MLSGYNYSSKADPCIRRHLSLGFTPQSVSIALEETIITNNDQLAEIMTHYRQFGRKGDDYFTIPAVSTAKTLSSVPS